MQLLAEQFPFASSARRVGWIVLGVAMVVGCQERAEITRYTVDKPPAMDPASRPNPQAAGGPMAGPFAGGPAGAPAAAPAPTGPPTDRTLGAIVPLSPQGWFFKLTGPIEAVAAQEPAFQTFLKSVSFSSEGKPAWTLPAGWQERPGNQIRYATLVIPGGETPLEATVVALPNQGANPQEYALVNVNRWRGQLQLPPITQEQMASESTPLELSGTQATYVNLAGHAAPNSMGQPPILRGAADGN
jgi:hypothetical protein